MPIASVKLAIHFGPQLSDALLLLTVTGDFPGVIPPRCPSSVTRVGKRVHFSTEDELSITESATAAKKVRLEPFSIIGQMSLTDFVCGLEDDLGPLEDTEEEESMLFEGLD